jgi:hypothetical protein
MIAAHPVDRDYRAFSHVRRRRSTRSHDPAGKPPRRPPKPEPEKHATIPGLNHPGNFMV